MNDILQDIEAAELHTCNTIKIITSLQNTITKLNQDDDTSDVSLSRFEEETEYLKELTLKVANDLTPPVPNSSSIHLGTKSKTKSRAIDSSPKFIKAKPKIMFTEKSQQTLNGKSSKVQNKVKPRNECLNKKCIEVESHVSHNECPLTPTKYLQHTLIPVNGSQSIQNNGHVTQECICKNNYDKAFQKANLQQPSSSVEHFAKLMQLCMDVKEDRELDLEKQVYNLEVEMQTVIESNKNLFTALEKLEGQNETKKLVKDSSTNTLTDVIISNTPHLPSNTKNSAKREECTDHLTEDLITCIQADIQDITSNVAKTNSRNRLIFRENMQMNKPKCEFVKHVSFLEKAIASMQSKLETAQNKQVELAIQSKAVVETAHRMTNKPWIY